ncbi:MAG: PP2C family protein-serine/threonine phosphatase [Thermoanaerobaculia bacterium]
MRTPPWSELVRLPAERAVERLLDVRHAALLRVVGAVSTVAATVIAIALTAEGRPARAGLWAGLLAAVLAAAIARRRPRYLDGVRYILLGLLVLWILLLGVSFPQPGILYAFAGWVFPALLLLLRLTPGQTVALAALFAALGAWDALRMPSEDAGPGIAMAVASLGWTAAAAALSHRATRTRRRELLAEWYSHASAEQERSRMRSELDDARTVQLAMLPRGVPEHPALDLAAMSLPATEVGGDYYDFLSLPAGRLAVVVADVSGHGMASGLVLSGVRSGLHLLREELDRPVDVLGRLARMLAETIPERMFVTLQIAVFDPSAGTVTVANAGHPPAILVAAGGEVTTLGAPAPPLGTRLEASFQAVDHPFEAGDTALLYSDGAIEVRNHRGEPLGEPRLLAEARRAAARPGARELRDALLAALAAFKGDVEQEDDLTLVVVRRGPAR